MEITSLQEKIKAQVDSLAQSADKNGHIKFSVCDIAPLYGWDRDYYMHRMDIQVALEKRGYKVSSAVNHGVIDYEIVKPLSID